MDAGWSDLSQNSSRNFAKYDSECFKSPSHSTPWEQHSTGDGKQYYFNRATGETTWDRSRTLYPN